ncbi:MAG: M48 family metallopeptidase [Thermodesulfobacteriota bacterium]
MTSKTKLINKFEGLPVLVREHHRAKRVLIRFVPGAGLKITIPVGFDPERLPFILEEKRFWIQKTRKKMEMEGFDPAGSKLELPGEMELLATGEKFPVEYRDIGGERNFVREEKGKLVVDTVSELSNSDIREMLRYYVRKKAQAVLSPWIARISRGLGLYPANVRVRMQKTRWGSCSEKGNINLNAKLLFLPPELVDQLLVHELCHLAVPDHSVRFWDMVARFRPDYREMEKGLRLAAGYLPAWVG